MTTATVAFAKKIPGAKILVETTGGDMLVLKHKFAHRDDAKLFDTLTKIRAARTIDMRHWRYAAKGEF